MKRVFLLAIIVLLMTSCSNAKAPSNATNVATSKSTPAYIRQSDREQILKKYYDDHTMQVEMYKYEDELYLEISCLYDEPWQAATAYSTLKRITNTDEYKQMNAFFTVGCGGDVLSSNHCRDSKGQEFDPDDYISEAYSNGDYTTDETDAIRDSIVNNLVDFLSS